MDSRRVIAEGRGELTAGRPQAKKKPVKKMKPEDLKVDLSPRLETVNVSAPPARQGGAKVGSSLRTCSPPQC